MVDNHVQPSYTIPRKPVPRQWRVSRDNVIEGDESFPLVHIQHPQQGSQAGEHNRQLQAPESTRPSIRIDPTPDGIENGRNANVPTTSIARCSDFSTSDVHLHKDPEDVPKQVLADSSTGSHSHRPMWNSRWLHRITLLIFGFVFTALLLALILLYHFAEANHGLSTQETSNHYAWTYSPTALLVFILAGWRQIDFTCRILAPWRHAMNGPTTRLHIPYLAFHIMDSFSLS